MTAEAPGPPGLPAVRTEKMGGRVYVEVLNPRTGNWNLQQMLQVEWDAYQAWRRKVEAGEAGDQASLLAAIPHLRGSIIPLLLTGDVDETPGAPMFSAGSRRQTEAMERPPSLPPLRLHRAIKGRLSPERLYLVFDTETTGLAHPLRPAEDPSQPEAVQLAALLIDASGMIWGALDVIIEPAGIVPDAAAQVHGLTTDIVRRLGVDPHSIAPLFGQMARRASALVAHNIPFDDTVMAAMAARCGITRSDRLLRMPHHCTKDLAQREVGIAPTPAMVATGRHHPKAPTLAEAYRHFFGREIRPAHHAAADCRACAEVFLELLARGLAP